MLDINDATEGATNKNANHRSLFSALDSQNKSTSTADAMRVEANLPGTSAACAIF